MSDFSQQPPIPPSGRIDIHCHLLPGVDDGCQTVRQALECVRLWMAAGFVGSVCTPHVGPGYYPGNTPDNIAGWMAELRAELAGEGLDYRLWDGGEVRIAEETIEWFSYWGLPTLGPGKCVLLDYWGATWPDFCNEACEFLLENGYRPIVAHPERLRVDEARFDEMLAALEGMGVWLQGNLNSLSGGEGPTAQSRALRLLREDRYFALATDAHGPADLSDRLEALRAVEEEIGPDAVTTLFEERQRRILAPTEAG